jgi:hypothetical protein
MMLMMNERLIVIRNNDIASKYIVLFVRLKFEIIKRTHEEKDKKKRERKREIYKLKYNMLIFYRFLTEHNPNNMK